MKVIRLRHPAGIDNLRIETAEPRPPGPGEVVVRVRANSLNYHDYVVVSGEIKAPDGRVSMSDGAGEVVELGQPLPGEASVPFAIGDRVMSVFYQRWLDGRT
ncbi:MAG: alcohol dehydrogenase catalytic domain-containing protein [Rubrivivax sp.]|nr:alcohol dehydrogenase catalytic domain-containing protein [Rubrivivax sp.]